MPSSGLGASAAAAYTHYHLLYDPAYRSFCDVNETISCTQVYLSRFSTVRGIPVALFGATAFVAAALLAGQRVDRAAGRARKRAGLPVRAVDALARGHPLSRLRVVRPAESRVPVVPDHVRRRDRPVPRLRCGHHFSYDHTCLAALSRDVRVFAGSPLAIVVADSVLCRRGVDAGLVPARRQCRHRRARREQQLPQPTPDQTSEFERWYASQPRVPLVVPADGAKVLVVKFNDFQCPACGQSYLQYKPIFAKYEAEHPGAVKLVLKDYPLNRDCNDALAQSIHSAACEAAVAVRLSQAHNKVEAMEEWLYTHQPAMTPPSVRQAARDIGQITDFDAKYQSTLSLVKGDVALGRQLGIKSTPTFFINGVKVEGALPPQYFDQAIALRAAARRRRK